MIKRIVVAFAAALSIAAPIQAASGDLTVGLAASQTRFAAADRIVVDLSVANQGRATRQLLSWMVADDGLEDPLFVVKRDGVTVSYTGPIFKRAKPADSDTLKLGGGVRLLRSVDLSDAYDFSISGTYTIRYRAAVEHKGNAADKAVELESNELTVVVEGRAGRPVDAAPAAAGITFTKCTAAQQADITNAVAASSAMANGASSYLANTPAATSRYVTWFGTFSVAGWNTAKTHFAAIKDALDNKPLSFNCGCKKSYYAFVYPNQPYAITVCRAFWTAPMTGTDSKGGTIIHELSHFNVVAGTDDWAYGQTNAKALAISDPAKALDNADSHEYFAENTPALP